MIYTFIVSVHEIAVNLYNDIKSVGAYTNLDIQISAR